MTEHKNTNMSTYLTWLSLCGPSPPVLLRNINYWVAPEWHFIYSTWRPTWPLGQGASFFIFHILRGRTRYWIPATDLSGQDHRIPTFKGSSPALVQHKANVALHQDEETSGNLGLSLTPKQNITPKQWSFWSIRVTCDYNQNMLSIPCITQTNSCRYVRVQNILC